MKTMNRCTAKVGDVITLQNFGGDDFKDGMKVTVVGFKTTTADNDGESIFVLDNELYHSTDYNQVIYLVASYDLATGTMKPYPIFPEETTACKKIEYWYSFYNDNSGMDLKASKDIIKALRVSGLIGLADAYQYMRNREAKDRWNILRNTDRPERRKEREEKLKIVG